MAQIYASKTNEIQKYETEHENEVRRLAGECMVLLENDGVLPFSEKIKKIALYGTGARHTGFLYAYPCVSFRLIEKPARINGRSTHGAAIYATYRYSLSRPMFGHTPRKLPQKPEQSPGSSQYRANRAGCAQSRTCI